MRIKSKFTAIAAVLSLLAAGFTISTAVANENQSACDTDSREYLEWQEQVSRVNNLARKNFYSEFSWSEIQGCNAVIKMKNGVPSPLAQMAKAVPRLRVEGETGFSHEEIIAEQLRLYQEARETVDGKAAAYTDFPSATIHIEVSDAASAKMMNMMQSRSSQGDSRFKVVYDVNPMKKTNYDALYGGGYLSTCTTAFSVRGGGYENGLLTAGHCANNYQTYGSVSLSLRDRHKGSYGDVAWYSTDAWTAPEFYSQPGQLVSVTDTNYPMVGQRLCLNGQGTRGRFCDETVWNVRTCSSDGVCNLTAMSSRKARPGDSGGPWFSSSIAYGVHSGVVNFYGVERDVFTPVQVAESVLGVSVKR